MFLPQSCSRLVVQVAGKRQLVSQRSTSILTAAASTFTPGHAVRTQSRIGALATVNKGFLVSDRANVLVLSSRGAADYPKHIKVTLPALSPTMQFGTIISWEKRVGDKVAEGDLLCEIETDKATMGFETPEEGFLAQVFLDAGAKDIPIGRLLCIIVEKEEDIDKFKEFKDDGAVASAKQDTDSSPPPPAAPKETSKSSSAPPPPPPRPSSGLDTARNQQQSSSEGGKRAFASPAAKKLAKEKGIDLNQISKGSGMDGMITTKDLEGVSSTGAAAGSGGAGQVRRDFAGGMPTPMGEYTDAELSNMRKTIAKRLQASKLEIPHYYLTVECEMDAVMKLRADVNKQYEKEGVKLSLNDFIIKATALACKRVPACNSAWMDTAIREYHSCDVCVAVDMGSGLITPIVTGAENRGLADISETVKELATRAKAGKLQPSEFMGGTITVSNLGMFDIEHFTAIINPPQSCILAVGGTTKKVVPTSSSNFETKHVMKVTLSCDHRVVDGAVGATWLKHFKKFMEQPTSMLL